MSVSASASASVCACVRECMNERTLAGEGTYNNYEHASKASARHEEGHLPGGLLGRQVPIEIKLAAIKSVCLKPSWGGEGCQVI